MAAVIAIPLVIKPRTHPHVIFNEVRSAYKTIDTIPTDKIAIISIVWSAGTEAENGPQTEALMRHMFKKNIKFAVISWDPVGAELTYKMGADIAKEMHKEYGTDWVHLGYNPGPIYAVISGMGQNFIGTLKKDRFNKSLTELAVTKNIKNHKQIGAVAEITPSGTIYSWITFFSNPYHVPLIYCPTAVMAAEAYPFIDSGQIVGMLNGVIGAAQYETLLGMGNQRTYAAAASWALSSAHILVIILIVLGNLGYLAMRHSGTDRTEGGRR